MISKGSFLFFVFVLHSILFSICLRCTQRKSGKDFTGWHQVDADLFLFVVVVFLHLEKHHACQHVQYGNQNYLNLASGLVFLKSTCAVVKYHPTNTNASVPLGRKNRHTLIYIWKLLIITN